jgi:transcriptional regulator with XRE-family HTH domain
MQLLETGRLIRERRQELGLSQRRLAKLAGVSRVTVNQVENGSIRDLGVSKLTAIFRLVGLDVSTKRSKRRTRALDMASLTASVSYQRMLGSNELAKALASGEIPRDLEAHISTLLDEAPLPLIVMAVEEAARIQKVPPREIWQHLASWAIQLQSPRRAWA